MKVLTDAEKPFSCFFFKVFIAVIVVSEDGGKGVVGGGCGGGCGGDGGGAGAGMCAHTHVGIHASRCQRTKLRS